MIGKPLSFDSTPEKGLRFRSIAGIDSKCMTGRIQNMAARTHDWLDRRKAIKMFRKNNQMLADSGLYAVKAGEFHLLTCASPAYLERHGAPSQPLELGLPAHADPP